MQRLSYLAKTAHLASGGGARAQAAWIRVHTPYWQPCCPLTVELSGGLAVQTASAQPARLHLLSSYYVPCTEDKQVKERNCLHFRSLHAVKGAESVERGIYQVGAQDRSSGKGDASLFTTLPGSPPRLVCVCPVLVIGLLFCPPMFQSRCWNPAGAVIPPLVLSRNPAQCWDSCVY